MFRPRRFNWLRLCRNPQGAGVQGEFVMTAANGDEVFGRYMSRRRR
jgi:hypothetical protein